MIILDIIITAVLTIIVVGLGVTILTPAMDGALPSENLCREFNDPYNQTLFPDNPQGMNKIATAQHFCFKNESGWHLNESVPVILI